MCNDVNGVGPESYLTLHYAITGLDGVDFVSTFGLSPATLQMGNGQLSASLEACLLGLQVGDYRLFTLPADEAFGQHNPNLLQRIARSALPPDLELKENSLVEFKAPPGDAFSSWMAVSGAPGGFAGFVRELDERSVLFDFNHPLAGQAIRFEVQIVGIL